MTGKTQAERLREKTERLAARQQQATGHETPAASARQEHHDQAAEPVLAKPVRSTLDLSPATHRDLQAWLGESAVRLGRARVTKQDVLEALVKRLLRDETLTKMILADLKDQ
jgi:DNA primase large subunit